VGEQAFKKQLWQCMVGQALLIKQNIETRRSKNEFGIIVWQFNEIWPTGGWGSIEYGTVGYTKGQVLGGRWKPLHYWYKSTIYDDVMATCGHTDSNTTGCYVNNDAPVPLTGTVEITSINFASGAESTVATKKVNMPAGVGQTMFFDLGKQVDGTTEMLHAVVKDSTGKVLNSNFIPMVEPKNMKLPKAAVSFKVATAANPDGSVDITVTTDKVAVYVTLTTLAQGRFSDNAFVMTPGAQKIQFLPIKGFVMSELTSSLRVEHTAAYM